jgi:hypothetical protein
MVSVLTGYPVSDFCYIRPNQYPVHTYSRHPRILGTLSEFLQRHTGTDNEVFEIKHDNISEKRRLVSNLDQSNQYQLHTW